MARPKARVPLQLLLAVLLLGGQEYCRTAHAQTITGITSDQKKFTPAYGSRAGGTRLWISGFDFADPTSGVSEVYICGQPCDVVEFLTSMTLVVCDTRATTSSVEESVQVCDLRLIVNNQRLASASFNPTFQYRVDRTPWVDHLYPPAGTSNSRTRFQGKTFVRDVAQLRSITIGDYQCNVIDPNIDNEDFNTDIYRAVTCAFQMGCLPDTTMHPLCRRINMAGQRSKWITP